MNGVVEKYFEVQYVSSNTEVPTTPPTTAPSVLLGRNVHVCNLSTWKALSDRQAVFG